MRGDLPDDDPGRHGVPRSVDGSVLIDELTILIAIEFEYPDEALNGLAVAIAGLVAVHADRNGLNEGRTWQIVAHHGRLGGKTITDFQHSNPKHGTAVVTRCSKLPFGAFPVAIA